MEEMKNITIYDIHPPESISIIKGTIKDAIKNKVSQKQIRIEYIHKNGNIIIADVIGNVIYDNKGRPVGVAGVSRNITDKIKALNALTESEGRYKYLIENLSVGVCINDHEENFILANKEAEYIFGAGRNELLGKNIKDFVSPENFKLIKQKTENRKKGKKDNYDIEIIKKTGEKRIINVRAIPNIKDKKNIGTIAIIKDVTEEKAYIKALKISEENYKSLFENSPVSLWEEDYSKIKKLLDEKREEGITDFRTFIKQNSDFVEQCNRSYIVKDVNKETLKLLKIESKEILFNNPHKFFTNKSFSLFKKVLVAFANDVKFFDAEIVLKDINGNNIDVYLRLFVFDNYKKVIVSMTDISNRKQVERQLINVKIKAEEANQLKSQQRK